MNHEVSEGRIAKESFVRIETFDVKMMKQIIREWTLELMECGGTTTETTCEVVAEEHPKLYAALGADRVLALCREIHESSDPVESAWLQELFATFNVNYFRGQLGDFTVLAVYDPGRVFNGVWNDPISGRVDFLNRQILIAITESIYAIPCMLLNQMAHALTVTRYDDEEAFISEMRRLRDAGAPVDFPKEAKKVATRSKMIPV